MRTVLAITAGLGSLAAIVYMAASPNDCEQELDACLSDPPLFVKLKGLDAKTYCLGHFKACLAYTARTSAEKAAAFAAAKQRAADTVLFTNTAGVSNSWKQPAEPFDLAITNTSGD